MASLSLFADSSFAIIPTVTGKQIQENKLSKTNLGKQIHEN